MVKRDNHWVGYLEDGGILIDDDWKIIINTGNDKTYEKTNCTVGNTINGDYTETYRVPRSRSFCGRQTATMVVKNGYIGRWC